MPTHYHPLSNTDALLAALLILINGLISVVFRLGLEARLFWASVRTCGQLMLTGYILQWIFLQNRWSVMLPVMLFMTLVAGWAATRRVHRRYRGMVIDSAAAVLFSSWTVTWIALLGIIGSAAWADQPAQFVIPLLGMILGNTLTGMSLGMDRLGDQLIARRNEVELRLSLGATRWEAARDAVREAIRTGMVPTINAMMVVGLVSLPGMMTGQMLAGVSPLDAVRYQIVIMFLVGAGTALGTITAVLLAFRRLFNSRHQFLADRLQTAKNPSR